MSGWCDSCIVIIMSNTIIMSKTINISSRCQCTGICMHRNSVVSSVYMAAASGLSATAVVESAIALPVSAVAPCRAAL